VNCYKLGGFGVLLLDMAYNSRNLQMLNE